MRSLFCALAALACSAVAQAQTTTATFSYQGVLDNSAQPFSGCVDVSVGLYNHPEFGDLVATGAAEGVDVTDGLLSFSFEFDTAGLGDRTLWAELGVRDCGPGPYQQLQPRQLYAPAARAVQASGAQVDADRSIVFKRGSESVFIGSVTGDAAPPRSVAGAWQSFVAGNSGYLSGAVGLVTLPPNGSVFIDFYEGEGTGSIPMFSSEVTDIETGIFFFQPTDPEAAFLAIGQTYTIAIRIEDLNTSQPLPAEFVVFSNDAYPGRGDFDPAADYAMRISLRQPGDPITFVRGLDGKVFASGSVLTLTDPGDSERLLNVIAEQQDRIDALERAVERLLSDAPSP